MDVGRRQDITEINQIKKNQSLRIVCDTSREELGEVLQLQTGYPFCIALIDNLGTEILKTKEARHSSNCVGDWEL